MSQLSWREWMGVILVTMLVATCTWVGLNVGKMLYADWLFLHTIRVNTEQQQRQAPPPQSSPPQK